MWNVWSKFTGWKWKAVQSYRWVCNLWRWRCGRMNRRDSSSASPSCRPHRQPVTSLQNATVWIGRNAGTVRGMSVKHGEQCGEVWCGDGRSCHGTPLPLPVGWSGPAGSPLLLVQQRAFCPYGSDQLWCGALVHLYELRSHISANTHALSAGPLTSVYDSPVVVEDYSALVQGRNCVQQVEGAQIPLRLQLRKIPLSYLDNLNLS